MLAQKGGVDVREFRRNIPAGGVRALRLRLQVHGHLPPDARRRRQPVVRAYVKGAPDVVLEQVHVRAMPSGASGPSPSEMRAKVLAENERIASQGRRVHGPGAARVRPARPSIPSGDLMALMQDLEMSALIGEVDPPRAEAVAAIAKAKHAGIRVRMITGDHAVTAAAIADELGIRGPRRHRRRVRGAERRGGRQRRWTGSAWSPGWRPSTRSGWSRCSSARATSSR